MAVGVIIKALSGFYYVRCGDETLECRARGKFRRDGMSPLVGDRVEVSVLDNGNGSIDSVFDRRNSFIRPAVANIDCLVILCSAVIPVTDPFLADRVAVIAEQAKCGVIICINKCDLDPGDSLFDIYSSSVYRVIRTSAVTGEGVEELRQAISGKICAFTGNSGVGKSSLLKMLHPGLDIPVGEVSEKLGRGRHTTRHVELFSLSGNTYIADTPGFASFDTDMMSPVAKDELQYCFPEFAEHIGHCRFADCAHLKEPDCAVRSAVADGRISQSRYDSYVKLYEISAKIKDWEIK